MQDRAVYDNITRLREMIGTLVRKEPALLEHYMQVKTSVEVSLANAVVDTKDAFSQYITRSCVNDGHVLEDMRNQVPHVMNKTLLDTFTGYAEELPSREPLYYGDYAMGWLSSMALDLALLKRVAKSQEYYPSYKQHAEKLSEKQFDKLVGNHSERISYTCHFPSLDKEKGQHVVKTGAYNAKWSLPVRRSWYATVFQKGLAVNDIAGKTVVVTSAVELSASEQPVWEKEKIKLYKATVAYAKTVRKGSVQSDSARIYELGKRPEGCILTNIEYEDFIQLNPNFNDTYPDLSVSPSQPQGGKLIHPLLRARPGRTAAYCQGGFLFHFNNYTSDMKGFIEKRYLSIYQNSSMAEPKTASGTTPLRAIAVLRGRIIKEVLAEMGVK